MNLDSLGYSLEEQIFYGVITLYLYECTGEYNDFDIKNVFQETLNEKNIEEVLLNLKPLNYLDKNYDNIYLPCIPETNIKQLNKNKIITRDSKTFLFSHPLIKFDINLLRDSDEFKNLKKVIGIMSGKRSAIIKGNSGKFYRLKGCGNYKSGFTLLKDEDFEIFPKKEIRGCQFENNVFRELYYTYRINEILQLHKIPFANVPIGYFKYDNKIKFIENSLNLENEIINEIPEIDKYCSIYETLGDRRLGTHLLKGLEILLESIVELAVSKYKLDEESFENIYSLFPEKRRNSSIESIFAIKEIYIPEGMSLKEWCGKPIYKKEVYDNLIGYKSLMSLMFLNKVLIKIKYSSNLIEDWGKIFEKKINFKKIHYYKIIEDLKQINIEKNKKSFLEYILDIFIRIGYETAKIKRILQDNEINWGTYNGHSPLDIFCSAHYNNFIVLPTKYSFLLSPIDFDLSFSKKNFINNDKNSQSFRKHDESIFDQYMNREINKLLYNIINPNENFFDKKEKNIKNKLNKIIYFLLNDSLIETYMKTFDLVNCDYLPKYNKTEKIIDNIVKLCLISTYDRIS